MRRGLASGIVLVGVVVGACVGDEAPNNVNVIVAGDGGDSGGNDSGGSDGGGNDGGNDSGGPDGGGNDGGETDGEADGGLPSAIGNVGGLAMWFSGDTGVTTNGTAVTKWTSHGGAPVVLTADGAATPPSVTTNGIGGKSTIHLDGTPGNGTCPCPGFSGALGFDLAQPITVVALVNKTRWTDNTYNYGGTLFANTAAPPNRHKLHGFVTGGPAPTWALTGSSAIFTNPFSSNDFEAPHLVTAVLNAGSSLVRIDGVQRATGSIGAGSFGSTFLVGTDGSALGSFQGEIGELAVFKRALGDTEMAMVEATLKFPYGLK